MRTERREGREGNRWINKPPSADEIAAWFTANIEVDERLDAANYVGGVTLIPSNEKSREVVGWNDANEAMMQDVWDLVFVPYIKVETRLKYFHDLMAVHPEWHGKIEANDPKEVDRKLPDGFFRLTAATAAGEVRFICCSKKVTIYEAGSRDRKVKDPPPGTKAVATLYGNGGIDPHAVEKAETGAVGRALGMAGILVIPGTGIATAEDIQEMQARPEHAESRAATLPPVDGGAVPDNDEELRKQVSALLKRMDVHPKTRSEFNAWANERGFTQLADVTSPALRGMLRRAEKEAVEAELRAEHPEVGDEGAGAEAGDAGADPKGG